MAILAARGHGTGLAVDPYKLLECECGRSACETPMHKSLGRGGTTVCSSSGWVGLLVSPQPAPPLSQGCGSALAKCWHRCLTQRNGFIAVHRVHPSPSFVSETGSRLAFSPNGSG